MSKLFTKGLMFDRNDIKDWKVAIHEGVKILVKNDISTQELEDAILKSTEDFGAYYVLERGIALLHAPPADYVKKVGVSFMLLEDEIKFNDEEKYAKLIFTLAAKDSTSHIGIIQEFGEIFTNKKNKEKIMACKTVAEIETTLKEIGL